VPLPDGTRLAARLWLPEDAEDRPVPALLEYIPYHKRDHTHPRDSVTHPYLAGHGYACVRVDLRGSGESEGVLRDEYLETELDDGEAVIAWIAGQPWCDGQVAMMGISWGGFNALQLAARRPGALGTVITLCSTDDRYADDVHYMGGCLLGDNLSWSAHMFALNTAPPDPELVGERWREMWLQRLEQSGLWLEDWLRHQRRDDYWKRGSVCEDWNAIQVPVLAVSGWADAYTNAVLRLLTQLPGPRQGIIGPWAHTYPHLAIPGPGIGFLQEVRRWLDHHLRGADNGIDREPMLRAYLQDSSPPSTGYRLRPGRWVGEPVWPARHAPRTLRLTEARLVPPDEPIASVEPQTLQSPLSVGLFSGKWCSESAPPDLPDDQREEDGGCLVFDSAPLTESLDLLGAPVLELDVESDRPVAMLAARLSDVLPDGAATRVTYGLLNLCHRESHEAPRPLEPGARTRVRLRLNDCGQTFRPGHKLRLALSTSYWPHAWTPPEPVRLTVHLDSARLHLPMRPGGDETPPAFAEPEGAPPIPVEQTLPPDEHWHVIRKLGRNESVLEVLKDKGGQRFPGDWEVRMRTLERYGARHADWHSVFGQVESSYEVRRGGWRVRSTTKTRLTSDAHRFYVDAELDAYEDDRRVLCRNWRLAIDRDHL
jgi:hypothetical protein